MAHMQLRAEGGELCEIPAPRSQRP
jgi:hypothetical protein